MSCEDLTPDLLLDTVRGLVRTSADQGVLNLDQSARLVTAVELLDDWLATGGRLPSAWTHPVPEKRDIEELPPL